MRVEPDERRLVITLIGMLVQSRRNIDGSSNLEQDAGSELRGGVVGVDGARAGHCRWAVGRAREKRKNVNVPWGIAGGKGLCEGLVEPLLRGGAEVRGDDAGFGLRD